MSLLKRVENNLYVLMMILSVLLSPKVLYSNVFSSCTNPPDNLVTSNEDTTHITLEWVSLNSPAETLWDIGYKAVGSAVWETINVATNPYVIPNLISGTTYEFRVRSDCGSTKSGWSINHVFATTDINNGSGCNLNLVIPDNNCPLGVRYNINVTTNQAGSILGSDVKLREVKIIVDHPWEQDLTLKLIAPNGSSVILAHNLGGSDIHGYGNPTNGCDEPTIFTENVCFADYSISDPSLLSFVGYFFPENSFNGFDGSFANGIWQIEICDDAADHVGNLHTLELGFSIFNCTAPTNVFITNELESSLTVNWSSVIPGEQSRVSISEVNEPTNPPSIHFTNDNFLNIDHLQLNTTYEIFVQRACIGGRFSDFSCVKIGRTKCSTSSPSIVENFDSESICSTNCDEVCELSGMWKNVGDDELDWIVNQGATPTAFTGPNDDVTFGGKYLYLESSNLACSQNSVGYLYSNCIHIEAPTNGCHMSFSYYMYGLEVNNLKVQINDFSGNGWETIWQETGSKNAQWLHAYIDLHSRNGKDVLFRFEGHTGINGNSDIAIDQIEFYGSQDNGIGTFAYFKDSDLDGFGDENDMIFSCTDTAPLGYIAIGGDCDDSNAMINPDAIEIKCNQIDENCNGMLDDSDMELLTYQENIVQLCYGDSTQLIVSSIPEGRIEWYDEAEGGNFLTSGLVYNTGGLNRSRTFYTQDVVEIGSGLRITQVLINYYDSGVEIQNIEGDKDYTGWKVFVSDDKDDINNYVSIPWELGFMSTQQVATRTKSSWGKDFKWLSGNAFKGWVLLIDDTNNVQDIVFWNWSESDILNFSTMINGVLITDTDLPWTGSGFAQGSCPNGMNTDILLSGSNEIDSSADYICGNGNFGSPNPDLNYYNTCISGRSPVKVVVSTIILDSDIKQNYCVEGGSIEIHASNGVSPYMYRWSNGDDNNKIVDVLPDFYQVTVTDAIGCVAVSQNYNLSNYTNNFGIEIVDVKQIDCHGDENGKIIMQVLDGDGPYQFNWAGGHERDLTNSLDSITNLGANLYVLTVTDNKGCVIVSDEIVISEPPALQIIVDSLIDLNCVGVSSGIIYTTTSGGVEPYKFLWNNGFDTDDISDLDVGAYKLTVTDSNDCIVGIETAISQPASRLDATIKTVKNVSCYQDNDGMIEISPTGGNPSYTFHWTGGENKSTITNLKAGIYNVTINDKNNCTFSFENPITIMEPDEPITISPTLSSTMCDGVNNGEIILHTTGGIPPYKFSWSEQNNNSDTLKNLAPGSYFCTITDDFKCSLLTERFEIKQNEYDLDIESEELLNVRCQGTEDGMIDLTITGGVTPYVVKWNDNEFGSLRMDLGKGIYFATVTDQEGCTMKSSNYSIAEPDPMVVDTIVVNQVIGQNSNGVATVFAHGGTGSYTYKWNDPKAQTSQTAVGLTSGSYQVTITDVNGCSVVDQCSIVTVGAEDLNLNSKISSFPNPSAGKVSISYSGTSKLKFSLFSSTGQLLRVFDSKAKKHVYFLDFSEFSDGVYFIKVYSNDGVGSLRVVLMK